MIREQDIPTYVTLVKAREHLDDLRVDISLSYQLEQADQKEQAYITDAEDAHLDNLKELKLLLEDAIERVEVTLANMSTLDVDRKYMYLIGIHHPEFCDQDYLRDRDEWIVADTESEAIKAWVHLRRNWLQQADYKLVKVLDRKRVDTLQEDQITEEQFELFMDRLCEEDK